MVEWCTGLNEAGADLLSYQNRAALEIVSGVSKTALPTLPPLLLLAHAYLGRRYAISTLGPGRLAFLIGKKLSRNSPGFSVHSATLTHGTTTPPISSTCDSDSCLFFIWTS